MAFHVAHIDDLERIAIGEMIYRPVRRLLGVTAFDANAYTADAAGGELIEPHDETTAGSARHEELYLYAALAGEREKALEHLRIAFERDPRTREWAGQDDLVS